MADPNILHVGAEFDVSALIDGTQQAVASFDQVQEALAQAAEVAEASGDKWQINAANLMAQGVAAQDVTQNLVAWGATEQQAQTAVDAVTASVLAQIPALAGQAGALQTSTTAIGQATAGAAQNVTATHQQAAAQAAVIAPTLGKTTATQAANAATTQQTAVSATAAAQIAALQAQINQLNASLQQLQTQLAGTTTRTSSMGGAMGAARVEAGALTGSTGMMVGGLARVAAQSSLLAPIITAAFPIFAIVAFIAILDSAINKLMEWADEARKAADAQAELERATLKSIEAYDQSRASLAAVASSQADLATRMESSSSKVVDLTQSVDKLNKQVDESSNSYFKRLKDGAGLITVAIGELVGLINKSEYDLKQWNSRIAESTKSAEDYAAAIRQVDQQLIEMQAHRTSLVDSGASALDLKALDQQIANQTNFRTQLIAGENEYFASHQKLEAEMDQKALEEHIKIQKARAAFDESQARSELRAHAITLEEDLRLTTAAESERTKAEESIISSRINLLHVEASEHIISQNALNAGLRQLSAERTALEIEAARRRSEAEATTDQEILRRTVEVDTARINAAHTVSEEQIKLEESRAKRAFSDADTVVEVEAASKKMTEETTRSYSDQIQKLQQRAEVLEASSRIQKTSGAIGPAISADLGSEAIKQQLEGTDALGRKIKELYPDLYRTITEFNAQVLALQIKQTNDTEAQEKERADKIKRILATEANDRIDSLSKSIDVEKSSYDDSVAKVDAQLAEKKSLWNSYYSTIAGLAEQSYRTQIEILQREASIRREEIDQKIITEAEGTKRLAEIYAREEKAYEEMQKREVEAAKRAVVEEETEIKALTSKISSDFAQTFNAIITGQERVNVAFAKLGREIVLALVDKGIKAVVDHYSQQLAKLLADHSKFAAQVLGIHRASTQAEQAIDTQKAVSKETLIISQEEKQRAADAAEITQMQAKNAAEMAAQAAQILKVAASNDAQITSDAALAGAAAYTSTAVTIPWPPNPGPALANMAEAITTVQSLASIGSAERGAVLNENSLIAAHKGEMILPEKISSSFQQAIPAISKFSRSVNTTASSASTKAAENHFHFPTSIGSMQALDGASVRQMLEDHGDLVGAIAVTALKRHFRTNGVGG